MCYESYFPFSVSSKCYSTQNQSPPHRYATQYGISETSEKGRINPVDLYSICQRQFLSGRHPDDENCDLCYDVDAAAPPVSRLHASLSTFRLPLPLDQRPDRRLVVPLAISALAGAEMSLNKPMNKFENWLMNSGCVGVFSWEGY